MKPEPRTPTAHSLHKPSVPCGCVEDFSLPGRYYACIACGATYNMIEVQQFPVWRCYDCGHRSASPYVAATLPKWEPSL